MDTEHIELNGPDADASPGALSTFVTGLIETVQPDVTDVRRHIIDLQQEHPGRRTL